MPQSFRKTYAALGERMDDHLGLSPFGAPAIYPLLQYTELTDRI